MGILPLQFLPGTTAQSQGLTGQETFEIEGLESLKPGAEVTVKARRADGSMLSFQTRSRIDTPNEIEYFKNGGILPYVLRQAVTKAD
jgi:aconitate hydratase